MDFSFFLTVVQVLVSPYQCSFQQGGSEEVVHEQDQQASYRNLPSGQSVSQFTFPDLTKDLSCCSVLGLSGVLLKNKSTYFVLLSIKLICFT